MKKYMTRDFDYVLPEKLIAKRPLAERNASRLLVVDRANESIAHRQFTDFVSYLKPQDLVVFNDTRVIPARLFGCKSTGGKVECLVERVLSLHRVLAQLRCSKSPAAGSLLIFSEQVSTKVLGRQEEFYELEFCIEMPVLEVLERYGELPLPPYLERAPEKEDLARYQTIFAEHLGAVAAPTASLHFDQATLDQITKLGVDTAKVTLHVGAGTFSPVRVEDIREHRMHREYIDISESTCQKIKACKQRGGRVFAIGTTVVRALETLALQGEIQPYQGDTQIFIYPGYTFKCVDALVTNFHLPRSTLLMLVSAFAGYELVREAYQQAILQNYRFFSYGDAMVVV